MTSHPCHDWCWLIAATVTPLRTWLDGVVWGRRPLAKGARTAVFGSKDGTPPHLRWLSAGLLGKRRGPPQPSTPILCQVVHAHRGIKGPPVPFPGFSSLVQHTFSPTELYYTYLSDQNNHNKLDTHNLLLPSRVFQHKYKSLTILIRHTRSAIHRSFSF